MRIDQLWRYPVKSFGGECIGSATVEPDGLHGDHVWAVVDAGSGNVATAKRFRRFGVLLTCRARYVDDTDPRDPAALELTFPDGAVMFGDDPGIDALLSDLTGTAVRLEAQPRSYDEAPLHVLSRAAVEALDTGESPEVTLRRFRPQIVIDTGGGAGFAEDEWIGQRVSLGTDVVVEPSKRTARCVMVTLSHQEVPADRGMLRGLTAVHRVPNEPGANPAPCIGVYANVETGGAIARGDAVEVGWPTRG